LIQREADGGTEQAFEEHGTQPDKEQQKDDLFFTIEPLFLT
jgi:hypothetical protein